jgi:subtilisin family serine protease
MKQMKWVRFFFNVGLSMIILGGVAFAHPEEGRRKIVVFQKGTSGQAQELMTRQAGGRVLHRLPMIGGVALELPTGRTRQVLERLQRDSAVVEVYDDHVIGADHVISLKPVEPPATELFPWGVERIGTPAVFDLVASQSVWKPKVAVIDTGIDAYHPELKAYIAGGYNARAGEDPTDFQDYNGHGTHMAGIIAAASDGQGIIGVASQPMLVAVKVLDSTGHGYLSDLINGLQWVADHDIRVVNMSLSFSEDSPLLEEATKKLYQSGVVMVAAAGNRCTFSSDSGGDDDGGDDDGGDDDGGDDDGGDDDGGDDDGGDDDGGDDDGGDSGCDISQDPLQGGVKYPARYPWVLAVGATNVYDKVMGYSRSGPEVDLVAPGGSKSSGRILSTIRDGAYGFGSGTSQATAHVTGAVAAALQVAGDLSADEVKDLLQTTAKDLHYPSERQGAGLIAVDKMIKKIMGLP